MLNCIDNSGAAIVECVKVLKMKRHAKVGTSLSLVHIPAILIPILPTSAPPLDPTPKPDLTESSSEIQERRLSW